MRVHVPGNNSVARVDGSHLADGHVLRLRLGNLERRFQLVGLRDLRQNGAGRHAHTYFERHRRGAQLCQRAFDAGADGQLIHLFLFQLVGRLQLLDLHLLGLQSAPGWICR